MTKRLYILRGLPGSGKSHYVRTVLSDKYPDQEISVCSADKYWEMNGGYDFSAESLKAAHASCQMCAERSMANGIPIVVIDNTNIKREHYLYYLGLAKLHNYSVIEVIVGRVSHEAAEVYKKRQIHNVPHHVYDRMIRDFDRTDEGITLGYGDCDFCQQGWRLDPIMDEHAHPMGWQECTR